jgi:hypothetical protein
MTEQQNLKSPFDQAMEILNQQMPGAHVDVIADNFAFVWLPTINLDGNKYSEPLTRGLWVRIPITFPAAQPHGIVTREPLNPKDGHAVKGYNPNHDTCSPVKNLGGTHYYSWTWSGELGEGPKLRKPEDILIVVAWIERRIRIA